MHNWHVLVVDDEPDVHTITELALKHKHWRGRKFTITSAKSAKEAEEIVKDKPDVFDVALVDVIMESDDAGLNLCRVLRRVCERSLRIVLRTGQPGVAPEDKVLNEYDIDSYLAKPDATPDRLYAVIRAALRASQDIRTLVALKGQLEGFAACFQKLSSKTDLEAVMRSSLKHLEYKFAAKLTFFSNVDLDAELSERLRAALTRARQDNGYDRLHSGTEIGLKPGEYAYPVQVRVLGQPLEKGLGAAMKRGWRSIFGDTRRSPALQAVEAGIVVNFDGDVGEAYRSEFQHDLRLFLYNWRLAYGALCSQEDVAYQRALQEYQRRSRIETPRSTSA
ncbi:MAG: response regulator [Myxococcota bacterium]|nr:response regulator [Myxococcota bacterium]